MATRPVSRTGAAPPIAAAIVGVGGLTLDPAERDFIRATRPCGFILFARNCDHPAQVAALVAALRAAAGLPDAPVLIDQEGGRVARLKPPHWRHPPPAAVFAALHRRDPRAAVAACRLNARLIAHDLAALGIDVDCAPVLDVPARGSHDIVGDRAFGTAPETIIVLARAMARGLMDGGVAPVIKHIPGHGRAKADSHLSLPVVTAPRAALERDFAPFRALRGLPWAMTAHVLYTALDRAEPATTSPAIIAEIIRKRIGFTNVLLSDDLSMKALAGSLEERAARSRAAGCDVALHCNGKLDEMEPVLRGAGVLDGAALARYRAALATRRTPAPFDPQRARDRLAALLAPVA